MHKYVVTSGGIWNLYTINTTIDMDNDEIIIVIDNNRNSIKYYQKKTTCVG